MIDRFSSWQRGCGVLTRTARIIALGALALAAPAVTAAADPGASAWFETDQGKVRLIAATPTTGPGETVRLGLEFRLAPGWKVYWRSPGDAGLPPQIDWTGSTNLADAEIEWPAPRRFTAYNLETIGYETAVVLPITARLAAAGKGIGIAAALQYLTCKEICIPYETHLTLDLPAAGTGSGGHADLIEQYTALVPREGSTGGLHLTGARLVPGKKPRLDLSLAATDATLLAPDAFVDAPPGLGFGAPAIARSSDGHAATLSIPLSGDAASIAALAGRPLRVTVVDGALSLEAPVTPTIGAPPPAPLSLAAILGVALLGGFILNFMPCVLPVLSIKLLSATTHAGASRRAVRRGFLATAAGILTAFVALAAAMVALKAAGLAIGWGVQFQQPGFLTLMVIMLALFAGNLAGLFEIPLPAWLGNLAASGSRGSAPLGDFAAGVFATMLATPCSAPYLGTAIGFALAGSSTDILTVFLTLGIGLALPYFAVAAFPGIARLLPRPGHWMLTLRRILAVFLAGTALWLLTVLAAQTSPVAALAIAVALLMAGLLMRARSMPMMRRACVAVALALAFVIPLVLPASTARQATQTGPWQKFDEAAIDGFVRDGKIVFVDVTADWCVNCKVNERLVLQSDEVARRLGGPGTVAMRADWTRPDGMIAAFLRGFGRYGIPFYAVYGPATPEGQPLPEILTRATVLDALTRAAPKGGKDAGAAAPKTVSDGG